MLVDNFSANESTTQILLECYAKASLFGMKETSVRFIS